MEEKASFPSIKDLSILTAVVVMVYIFLPMFSQEAKPFEFFLFQISFVFPINFGALMSVISAVLTSAGVDWLLESHPKAEQRTRFIHWVLPGLTAWAIGVPLSQLKPGPGWWIVLGLGVLLLIAVIIGEYITVDITDKRFTFASIGLNAVTYALFLIFTVAINGMGVRLYFLVLTVFPFSVFAALRILSLRLAGKRIWKWALAIALILSQTAFSLHYFPISPLQFGLFMTGIIFLLTSISVIVENKENLKKSWIAPVMFFFLFVLIALFTRI